MIQRGGIILIHTCQLGLLFVLYHAQNYYTNHLGFMRIVSFYTKKVASGPISLVIDLLALLLLLVVLIIRCYLWKKGQLVYYTLPVTVTLALCIGFICWQWLQSPLSCPIFYLVSTGFLLAIVGQFVVLVLSVQTKKTKRGR